MIKYIITTIIGCFFAASLSYAQCDKKVILKASKTEYLDADSALQRSVEEQSKIVFDKNDITILAAVKLPSPSKAKPANTCSWCL